MQAQDVARRISGAVAGEVFAQVKTYQVPGHHKLISLAFTLFAICLSFSSPPLHPCHFIRPLFPNLSPPLFFSCLFPLPVCLLICLVVMASSLSSQMSPEFEVLHFKQRQGENLKDAWYRMIESYRNCTLEVNFSILLRNFYVGLDMSHRQLLDCVAKANFIEIDPSVAHEIIEGVVGALPQQKGPQHTQEETQIFEFFC